MYIESESNQPYREGDSVYEKKYLFNVKNKNKNKQFWTTTSAVSGPPQPGGLQAPNGFMARATRLLEPLQGLHRPYLDYEIDQRFLTDNNLVHHCEDRATTVNQVG